MIRLRFFLLFGFDNGTQEQKGHKGTAQEPSQEESGVTRSSQHLKVRTSRGLNMGVSED